MIKTSTMGTTSVRNASGDEAFATRPNRGALARLAVLAVAASAVFSACATVKVEAPEEPIEINLNVNVSGEVRVKLEREIDDLIAENPDIF